MNEGKIENAFTAATKAKTVEMTEMEKADIKARPKIQQLLQDYDVADSQFAHWVLQQSHICGYICNEQPTGAFIQRLAMAQLEPLLNLLIPEFEADASSASFKYHFPATATRPEAYFGPSEHEGLLQFTKTELLSRGYRANVDDDSIIELIKHTELGEKLYRQSDVWVLTERLMSSLKRITGFKIQRDVLEVRITYPEEAGKLPEVVKCTRSNVIHLLDSLQEFREIARDAMENRLGLEILLQLSDYCGYTVKNRVTCGVTFDGRSVITHTDKASVLGFAAEQLGKNIPLDEETLIALSARFKDVYEIERTLRIVSERRDYLILRPNQEALDLGEKNHCEYYGLGQNGFLALIDRLLTVKVQNLYDEVF